MNEATSPNLEQQIATLIQVYGTDRTALLPILRNIQALFHHVPPEAIRQVADKLSLPPAHVEGVTSFYHFLSSQPRGQYDIHLSDCIIDQLQGREEIVRLLCDRLGTPLQTTRSDRRVSIGSTSCTGLCDQGPAMLINGRAIPRLDKPRIAQIATLIEKNTPLERWPEALFHIDSTIRQRGALLNEPLLRGSALQHAISTSRESLLDELEHSGLRGRGGAGFPTALKWRLCRETAGNHYVVCNADEGEPGTFKDRELLRHHPHALIEGMTLAAWVTGAREGFIYLRGEYLFLEQPLQQVLSERREAGLLGEQIGGVAGFNFDITIHLGAGAYICGEESALLESLEGNRPHPRNRPPYPVTHGLHGQPTVVNNVETFIFAAHIALHGSDWLRAIGTEKSPGSKLLSISGDCARPGIYEFAFGTPLKEILDTCGADDPLGVQMGGASGSWITPDAFHRRLAFEDLATGGSLMVFGQNRDLLEIRHNFSRFFAHESCGFCTPCRVGTSLQNRLVEKIRLGRASTADLETLRQLGKVMASTSHCGLGSTAANPVLTTLESAPQHYRQRLDPSGFTPDFNLEQELKSPPDPT